MVVEVETVEDNFFIEFCLLESKLDSALPPIFCLGLSELMEDVVAIPTEAPWAEHVYHQYTVRAERRDELWDHLKREGVGAGVYYPHPLTEIPILDGRAEVPAKVPVSERLASEVKV